MWIPLITPIVKLVREMGGKWLDKQRAIADGKVRVAVAHAEAQAEIQKTKATAEIEWERTMAQASATSWKDEAWTIWIIVVLTGAMVPGLDAYVLSGFENIAKLPEWFGYAVLLAIGAAFGKNISKDFTSLKTASKAKEAIVNKINKRD